MLSVDALRKIYVEGQELEARFGFYTNKGFSSNIPCLHYERLLHIFQEKFPDVKPVVSEISINGNDRRIMYPATSEVTWQRKSNIANADLRDYDIRISSNEEVEIDPIDNFVSKVNRSRTRYSFEIIPNVIRLDMTEVMMLDENKLNKSTYEVELEYLGDNNNLDIFKDNVAGIFRMLRGTNIIYNNKLKYTLINDITNILGTFDKSEIFVEARNIKRKDLVYGGIVGNSVTNYLVTYKADGKRKMLIIHSTGIWLVYPPYEFNFVLEVGPSIKELITKFNGTIFDGELVKSPKIQYWYLLFDCIAVKGDANIQNKFYNERKRIVDGIANSIKTSTLTLDVKQTEEIKSPNQFFDAVTRFLNGRKNLEYKEDGLLFIPAQTVYNPMSQKVPMKDRVLTKVPDICKWKESIDITIDFALKWVNGVNRDQLELYVYDSFKKEMVPFVGNEINPLTPDMIDHTHPLTLNKPTNLVVEYEWISAANQLEKDKCKKNSRSKGILRPRLIRCDKAGPNRLSIALDIWEDIMNPITAEDIMGKTLSMTFSYHNRIKKGLFNLSDGILLDIGSGCGGDTAKWKRYSKIIAVEPDEEKLNELNSRIATFNLSNKVTVLNVGGEDTVTITEALNGEKADVISLMLSLSFFWSSSKHLDALVNTIVTNLKSGGIIIFLTINGDVIQQIFEPALCGDKISERTIGPAKLILYDQPADRSLGRPLDFILPDTIVGEQREYLVHLADLTMRLEKYDIYLKEVYRAEDEKFLSVNNRLFSSMYSYGYYVSEASDGDVEPVNIELPEPAEAVILPKTPTLSNLPSQSELPKIPIPTKETPVRPATPKLSQDLSWLNVTIDGDGPAVNDDTYAPLKCQWYDNLIRIATIGDGSCFIHAVLKAFYPPYQENDNSKYRRDMAARVRRDLAMLLEQENPDYPEHTYWETVAEGAFPALLMQEIKDESLIEVLKIDFSLMGLKRLFNSKTELGNEVFRYITDVFKIDLFIFQANADNLIPNAYLTAFSKNRPTVAIIGNKYHFEVIAVNNVNGFQTVFLADDPFVLAAKEQFRESGLLIQESKYDPDKEFIKNVVDAFGNSERFKVPDLVSEIFDEDDPFVKLLKRLELPIEQYWADRFL